MIKNPKESHCVWNIKIFILQGRRSQGTINFVDSFVDNLLDNFVDNFVNNSRDNSVVFVNNYATYGTERLIIVYLNLRY